MSDEEIKNQIKNILYRIMCQREYPTRYAKDIADAISQWWNNKPVEKNYTGGGATTEEEFYSGYGAWNNPNRDFNKLYLTGDDSGFTQLPDNSRGFTYKYYTQKNNYDPKTYEGLLIKDDEIVLPAKYEPAVRSLLGQHTYVNSSYYGGDNVAHHIQKIGQDENDNLEIQASDIWDFNPGDWNSLWNGSVRGTINKLINRVGHKVLDASGKPFILRDYAKIKFSNDVTDEELPWPIRKWLSQLPSYESMEDGMPHFQLPEIKLYNDPNKQQEIQEWYTEKQKSGGTINYLNLFK